VVVAREAAVDRKSDEVDRREAEMNFRDRELLDLETSAQARETELSAREDSIVRREAEGEAILARAEGLRETVNNRQRALHKNEDRLSAAQAKVAARKADLNRLVLHQRHDADLSRVQPQALSTPGAVRSAIPSSLHDPVVDFAPATSHPRESGVTQSTTDLPGSSSTPAQPPPLPPSSPPDPRVPGARLAPEALDKPPSEQNYAMDRRQAVGTGPRDDESETAAEELGGELLAARSIWAERVERLQGVLEAMMPTADEHGVAALVTSVRNELATVGLAVQCTVDAGARLGETAAASFERERIVQLGWGIQLRAQLDTIREIQAGLLLAANREPEAAASADFTQDMEDTNEYSGHQLGLVSSAKGVLLEATRRSDQVVSVRERHRLPRSLRGVSADFHPESSDDSLMRRVDEELEDFYTDSSNSSSRRIGSSASGNGDASENGGCTDRGDAVLEELTRIREEIDVVGDSA
jgi:hypothetical protein